ncbi:MAG: hypothetical protein K9M45_04655 [Kiritimatiellales bacterium]|nr:hypothetical protein [Kiritimatiellales bacterium]
MKKALKFIIGLVVVLVLLLAGLQLFLKFGLTRTLQTAVLPRLKTETGIDARVGGLSVDVLGGKVLLRDLVVKNPAGFLLNDMVTVDRISMDLDIPSLLRREVILVKSVKVENTLINVVRNKAGEINVQKLADGLPKTKKKVPPGQPKEPRPTEPPEKVPKPGKPVPEPGKPAPELPELLVKAITADATVRYIDLKLDSMDMALDLNVEAYNLNTRKDPDAPWGDVLLTGALGNDSASLVTDLKARVAPVTDPLRPSFDLAGKVMEIDPRLMEEIYSRMGIRSAPFGIGPAIHCRSGVYQDSVVALSMNDIVFEDKLAKKLGGVATLRSLKFTVPLEGTLQSPSIDVEKALYAALGDNAGSILESVLKGIAGKELGLEKEPESLEDAAIEILGKEVKEIGENEELKGILKQVLGGITSGSKGAPVKPSDTVVKEPAAQTNQTEKAKSDPKDLAKGEPSATNEPSPSATDALIEALGGEVEEIGENEELKKELKNLGNLLFGK